MKLFGLACEGITDQPVLENILCGYFENLELGEEITYLQPPCDETDQQSAINGWTILQKYLSSKRFRDDVLNTTFSIIQIDTDIAPELLRNNNNEKSEILVEKFRAKLVNVINQGETGFYEEQEHKIIFAISIHSLECWLYAYHNKEKLSNPKIVGCHKALSRLSKKFLKNMKLDYDKDGIEKTVSNYKKLSHDFLTRKHVDVVIEKDPSFRIFAQSLEKIKPVVL
ncbi:MAG: hypothetical protein PHP00_07315 [Thiotrichaceae bacterium]|nr:hypothetical protein [Thiotrichaceae bacterium]